MLSGSATVESLIPGAPNAIATAMETAGAGAGAARGVTQAWEVMSLPSWRGHAASSWEAFTPREAARTGMAPPAFNRVASALMRYDGAFRAARAEAQAAINDAAAAERATANAHQEHRTAVGIAALAKPGTPESVVDPFTDPGAIPLSNANSRYETARATLQQVGDEVAAEIRAAAGTTSGEAPGIEWWDQILQGPGRFVEGFLLQTVDTIAGVWEMLPIQYIWDDIVNDGDDWWEQYFVELWGGIIDSIVTDPAGAANAMWGEFIAADHWDEYAGEGVGRVTFNIASLAAAGFGALKLLKGLKTADSASTLTAPLKNSKGVAVEGDRIQVDGVNGLSDRLVADILRMDKGTRPDPSTYLSPEYIAQHLEKFDQGAVRFMTPENLENYGIGQRDGTTFVMARGELDDLILRTGGDFGLMEEALGLPEGFFEDGAVLIDIPNPSAHGLRVPSGNEAGANPQWIPGGELPTGFAEAVIDGAGVPKSGFSVSSMTLGKADR